MNRIRINENEYPVIAINGRMKDEMWDDRSTKTITLVMTYEQATDLFVDGLGWFIITEDDPEDPSVVSEFDNSDYNIAGDITDHRDGTVSVKMGKPTDLEEAYELLYGGE